MPHRRMTANDLTCRSHHGAVNVRNRRILPVPARSGGGRLTERTPAVQPRRRERVKVPLKSHSSRQRPPARSGGKEAFPILPAYDPRLQSGHSLPEATTFDAALISALPLIGRQVEEYPLR
jgi:hypothetical protein